MADHVMSIQNLVRVFGSLAAVNEVSYNVDYGEIFSILGPNGSGKTTTIRMLMGLLKPTRGTAKICGLDCFTDAVKVKRYVGYLPDEPIFYNYLKGYEIVRFVGKMHGVPIKKINSVMLSLAEKFELTDALGDYADNYSKGMKKKLALICAMLHEPKLLILDEPTNGLDPMSTRMLHQMMRDYAASGASVFFSTHLLDQAEKLSDRIAIMQKGIIAALGKIEELKEQVGSDSNLEDIFFKITDDFEARSSKIDDSEARDSVDVDALEEFDETEIVDSTSEDGFEAADDLRGQDKDEV